jgi:DNA-binding YbaB/EbfC family protein
MFDNLKNLANLPGLMQKAREMQEKMKQMQDEAGRKQVSAESGGGMVTAIVNGRMELVKIRIDQSRVDVNDTEMLEDVIVSAIRAAQAKAAAEMATEMHKLAGGMGLPPGILPNP